MIDNTKEYIICSAIWYKNGKQYPFQNIYGIDNGFVIGGFRHPMCIGVCPENPYIQRIKVNDGTAALPFEWDPDNALDTEQRFIMSYGRFVNRKEAFKLALSANQINRESILKTQGINIDTYKKDMSLYSEDIFQKQMQYDKVVDLFNNKTWQN